MAGIRDLFSLFHWLDNSKSLFVRETLKNDQDDYAFQRDSREETETDLLYDASVSPDR
jgi:hypothetical protein